MPANAATQQVQEPSPVDRDTLTGLMRGGALEAVLERTIHGKPEGAIGVCVLGIDRFRHINDLLGYDAGDRILREVADRLSRWLPRNGSLARLGGDDFAIVVPGLEEREAMLSGAAILNILEPPIPLDQREIFASASLGLSIYPEDGGSAPQLLRRASLAVARAKARGGGVLERATNPNGLRPEERYQMEGALRRALENNELTLRYQPQVDRDGKLRGLEALLVWNHPELGRVQTETFIRLAEEIGVIAPIGAWVLEAACRQMMAWRQAGLAVPRVAVNVSPLQFSCPHFVEMVRRVLRETGLNGDALELEITEGTILRDIEESAARMRELRSSGVRIAIDDFGVGYSPLTYLHRLPLDVVKVDRTFVSEITKPSGSLPVVHTITVLAHHRGLEVVAEGVETEGELELVRAARCDMVQGYLIGNPVPSAGIAELMMQPERLTTHFHAPWPGGY
ncbi:putative bifunctional diguanylate cyclase/phosphodiesterase [Paludibaculum fermentans]|uniref:Bifunctional diguanylate cyclase/phosphodiesterase n=1 Tax=Paludibaculum fermentans TaxID=1473598 RepID=A0A7S7NPX9_PALFE|nr:bifunctional diguanylate cyclase/phosphodiesterase [Paludibaculum fermentans]QOY87633.1 bifunctional diguanylate cyclase/phosphodiesterase [Paludibaculum fermentans]